MMHQTQNPEEQVLNLPDFSAMAPEDEGTPLPPKPPWWRRRGAIITIILIVLLILASFLALFLIRGRQRQVTYIKQQVTQSNFSLTVSATGPIQSAVYNLTFSGSGTIAEINVSVGQTVVKDQVLAKLNMTSLQDALNSAQASVLAAQTGVNNANANLSKTEAQTQTSVQSAQVSLNNANSSLATTQTQSQASINSAQTTLSNDQTNLTNTQAQSAASISSAQTALTNAQSNLSHTQATTQAQIASAQLAKTQACNPTPPATPVASSCDTATAAYNQAVAQANASVATAQGQVNSAQKALASAQTSANSNNASAQAQVNSAQQALASAESQASSSNTAAQNTVNTATAALASAQASANASVTSQQGSVNSAQSQLQTALVGLQTAQHNLDNATLLAPHAGIVTTINGNVGGTPGSSSSSTSTSTSGGGGTFITIADTSTLQVLASVNESDTANLKVGEPAQFTVSAYGNRIFTGTVSTISPLGQTVSNVVTYPVTIDVNKDDLQNANLLPGMTASTTIVVIQQPNVTLVPVNAINFARTAVATVNGIPPLITTSQATAALTQARQMLSQILIQDPTVQQDNPIPAYVIEQPGSQASFIAVPVVLGLTDDTYYVVLQGLSPGDLIVVGAVRG
jgi:HlyD family secretion protein